MPYALWVKCVAEVLGTAFAIWLGQSNVANELLAHTKGHGMGFGWLSLGYGLAFGIGVLLTGWISAYFNPALALAAWINRNGITSPSEYFAISFSTICGAFLGGLMVFLQFLPHFQIIPKPPGEFDAVSGRFLPQDHGADVEVGSEHDPMEQPTYDDNTGAAYDDFHQVEGKRSLAAESGPQRHVGPYVSPTSAFCREPTPPRLRSAVQSLSRLFRRAHQTMENMKNTRLEGTLLQVDAAGGGAPVEIEAEVLERMEKGGSAAERAMAAKYAKALKADQVAKLLCFCTRPAIYSPPLNWLCEFISTIALIVPIYVFQTQLGEVYPNTTGQYNMISGAFVGVLIILLVVGAGGPTGVAMSPARDMGPRLAHWVLPIRGKGSSEFLSYSWVPLTASMTAAVPSAFIVRGINHLISSGAPAPAPATIGSG